MVENNQKLFDVVFKYHAIYAIHCSGLCSFAYTLSFKASSTISLLMLRSCVTLPLQPSSFFSTFLPTRSVFLKSRSAGRHRSAPIFWPVCQINSNIIPQFKIVLFIITHSAARADYFFSSANRQVHAIHAADVLGFAFLVKKKNVGGEMNLAHNHLFTSSCCSI